jgi:hypothetical protein
MSNQSNDSTNNSAQTKIGSEEQSSVNTFSRRQFLGEGLKFGAGVLAAFGLSNLPDAMINAKGQENNLFTSEGRETPYSNAEIRVNTLGFPSMIFEQIDPNYYNPQINPHLQHMYSPLGRHNLQNFLPPLQLAIEEIGLEQLNSYDILYLVPGQFFSLPEGVHPGTFAATIPVGLSDNSSRIDVLPKLMGGVINLNVGLKNKQTANFTAEESLKYLAIHESMHERGLYFPEKIRLETGERVSFGNIYHPVPEGFYNEELETRLIHPFSDILGGLLPGQHITQAFQRSPLQLFLAGLLTIEEFNNSYEEGKPHLLEVSSIGDIIQKHYYTVDALLEALDDSENTWNISIQQLREYAEMQRFVPGYRIPEDGRKLKVGVIPLILVDRRALRTGGENLGNNENLADNLVDYTVSLNELVNFLNTQSRDKVEAELVTAPLG